MNSHQPDNERGIVLVIGAITLAAISLFIFACLQLVYGTAKAIDLTNIVYQTSQTMQSSLPYEDSALEAGAWYLHMRGFDGVVADQGVQTLSSGEEIELTYDDSIVPNRVYARARRDETLLAGLFSGFSTGITGLQGLEQHVQLGGTSDDAAVFMHVDNSSSMIGPGWSEGADPTFSELLQAYGLPVTTNLTNAARGSDVCWPISLSECSARGYPDVSTNLEAARACCSSMRRHLPFYLGGRAQPVLSWLLNSGTGTYYMQAPLDESRYAFHPYNPGIDYTDPPKNPLGLTRTDSGGTEHYLTHRPLTCGMANYGDINRFGIVDSWKEHPWDFHLDSRRAQYMMSNPGYRIVDFKNFTDEISWTHPDGNTYDYGYITGGDPRDWPDKADPTDQVMRNWGTKVTSQDICTVPWRINQFHLDQDELTECGSRGQPVNPELATRGCWNQYGALYHRRSDFYHIFLKITQLFLMGISEIVPRINLSVFSGPTSVGNITNQMQGGGPVNGNFLLYEGVDSTSNIFLYPAGSADTPNHIYENEVNHSTLRTKQIVPYSGSGFLNSSVSTISGELRVNHMLTYLHQDLTPNGTGNAHIFPTSAGGTDEILSPLPDSAPLEVKPYKIDDPNFRNINPLPDPALYPGLGGEPQLAFGQPRAYYGSIFMMPLENPKHPFVYEDTPGFSGTQTVYPGRCQSLQVQGEVINGPIANIPHGFHPSDINGLFDYPWIAREPFFNTRNFFPENQIPRMETIYSPFTMLTYPDSSWTEYAFAYPRFYANDTTHPDPNMWFNHAERKPDPLYESTPKNYQINFVDPANGMQLDPVIEMGTSLPLERVKTLAPCIFSTLTPRVGGTDLLGAFRSAKDGVQKNVAQQGSEAANIVLIFSDGEPNMPGNQMVVDDAWGFVGGARRAVADCKYDPDCRDENNNIVGGGDYDLLISDIKDEVEAIEALSDNVLTIVLFTDRNPGSPGVHNGKEKFKALFEPGSPENSNPTGRVWMEILGTDRDEYRESYIKALSIIAVLIRTYMILVE